MKLFLKICGGFIAAVAALLLFVSFLPDKKDEQPPKPAAQTQQKAAPSETICQTAGLGDTDSQFAAAHKIANDNGMIKTYYNGKVTVTFVNGHATNIQVKATKEHKAQKGLPKLLPTDAVKGETSTDESDAMVAYHKTKYTSQKLSTAVPNSGGNFERIDAFDKASGNYIYTVLAI